MRKQELHPRTAVINKDQKNKSKKARMDALSWLAANFPAAFDISLRIYPFKIGIMDDILLYADSAAEAGISKSKLREALVLFTRRIDYLACLKLREKRIDLQGNQVGQVSEEEAKHAAEKIKKLIEKNIKNSRKALVEKTSINFQSAANQSVNVEENFPCYPHRSSLYNSTLNSSIQPKTATVIVKHKAVKHYDPEIVARLKEKLGLSQNTEEKQKRVKGEKS